MRNKIIAYYISSRLHVALSLWAFCQLTALQQGGRIPLSLQLAIFCFGWAAYWYAHQVVPYYYKHNQFPVLRLFLTLGALLAGGILLRFQPYSIQLIFVVLGMISLCYAIPFGSSMGLRFIPRIKIFLIAVCWASFAAVGVYASTGSVTLMIVAKSILWVVLLTLPFDVRDMKKDDQKLKTIPQLLGLKKTRILGFGLALIIVFLTDQAVAISNLQYAAYVVLILVLMCYLVMHPKRHSHFTSFWIEGIPLLWYGISIFSLIFY
jgi:hypothetical protein